MLPDKSKDSGTGETDTTWRHPMAITTAFAPAPAAPLDTAILADPIEFIRFEHYRQRTLCDRLRRVAEDLGRPGVAEDAARILDYLSNDLPLHIADETDDLMPLLRERCGRRGGAGDRRDARPRARGRPARHAPAVRRAAQHRGGPAPRRSGALRRRGARVPGQAAPPSGLGEPGSAAARAQAPVGRRRRVARPAHGPAPRLCRRRLSGVT